MINYSNEYEHQLSQHLGRSVDIRSDPKYQLLISHSLNYVTLALSTPSFERALSHHLADTFNHHSSVYDKAIDSVYKHTHVGGSTLHHNLDGSHTWHGAVGELRERFPDDSELELVARAADHLLRDLTTHSGINLFLGPQDFLRAADFLCESFHIPKSLANDLLNINAAELLGAATATIAILLDFNSEQAGRLGEHLGRLSLSSYMAGNPVLLLIAGVCVGKICYDLWKGEAATEAIHGMVSGGLSASTFWLVAAHCPGPLFVGMLAGAAACYAMARCCRRTRSIMQYDFDKALQSQFAGYRSYYKQLSA